MCVGSRASRPQREDRCGWLPSLHGLPASEGQHIPSQADQNHHQKPTRHTKPQCIYNCVSIATNKSIHTLHHNCKKKTMVMGKS